jgi:predicted dehydrogenase
MVAEALQAGKHVFVEKPLAIHREELALLENAVHDKTDRQLLVGYNRRFSPLSRRLKAALTHRTQPCSLIYTVNAGSIPPEHWTQKPEIGGGRIIGEACHFIDLLLFLVGSPIIGVEARTMARAQDAAAREDTMTILLDFEDGSTGAVHYLANGSKKFPKEQIQVFSEGRIAVIDNFKSLRGYGWRGLGSLRLARQDKGHKAELAAFVQRILDGGDWLIPWRDLRNVSQAAFAAVERARQPSRGLESDA